jgi:predicted nucleic acid-binding protein
MSQPTKYNVILDACVLYPAPVRDILLNFAEQEFYSPKWSELIQEEWIRNLLINRPDLSRRKLKRTTDAMNSAFPEALVNSFESLIESLELPDPDDRHVLAAAIQCSASAIVTFNIKDFSTEYLNQFNIELIDPDSFMCSMIELNEYAAMMAFNNQLNSLKNPPKTKDELLAILEKCGLPKAVQLFKIHLI